MNLARNVPEGTIAQRRVRLSAAREEPEDAPAQDGEPLDEHDLEQLDHDEPEPQELPE